MALAAKYATTCGVCTRPIRPGDQIVSMPSGSAGRWAHETCRDGAPATSAAPSAGSPADTGPTRGASGTSIPLQVAARGLEASQRGAAAAAEAMHGERARWRRQADRNLIVLGTLGNNVPFVGLFGTVLGVIKAFDDLKVAGSDSESVVMSTLAEALVATAIGLLVAIPAVVAFNYFGRRLKVVLGGADELAHAVLSGLYGQEHAAKDAH